jgi:acyl-CoA thioester hydrolase
MTAYSRLYNIRTTDLDDNGHVHYSAYIDAASDLRYTFFAERGFPAERVLQLGVGPVYTVIVARFLREVRAGETLTITYELEGLSPSGTRWKVHHDILKSTGKKACLLDIEGVVLDLVSRAPAAPPPEFLAVFNQIPRSARFEQMPEQFRPT